MKKQIGIYGFFGEFRWLSNFYPCEIEYRGIVYPSTEHAYQAAKTNDINEKQFMISLSTKEVKKYGRRLKLSKDWNNQRIFIMHDILELKFKIVSFRNKLIETKDLYLEETNNWGRYILGCVQWNW